MCRPNLPGPCAALADRAVLRTRSSAETMIIALHCRGNKGKALLRNLFCMAGWFLAVLLGSAIAPRLYQHLRVRLPAVRAENWRQAIEAKKKQLSETPWKDSRPLDIIAGDSHVELGSWYELCAGNNAIRNCGLSMARIDDVAELIKAIGDRNIESVILMCGINNFGAGESVEECLSKYDTLLDVTQKTLNPKHIVVLSVMQIRQSIADSRSREINQNVLAFDTRLKLLCERRGATYVDVNSAVSTSGGLRDEFTVDGLHLNSAGYHAGAAVICDALAKIPNR